MTSEQNFNVSQMLWKPKLIKLTSIIPYPSRAVYIDPTHVRLIQPTNCKVTPSEDGIVTKETWVMCTIIYYYGTQYIHVEESADEVAKLCDKAFGYEDKIREIK